MNSKQQKTKQKSAGVIAIALLLVLLPSLVFAATPSVIQKTTPSSSGTGTVTLYCTPLNTFVEDLDDSEATCTAAGFTWAGNACCGEPEDGLESYATTKYPDKGCWMGKPTTSGEKINDQVLFSNGKFIGCIAEGKNSSLVALNDAQSSSKLISYLNPNICQNIGGYYCSSENRWQPYPSYDLTFKSIPAGYIPPNGVQAKERSSECCGASQCWNGTRCASSQTSAKEPNSRGNYRCLNGNWKIASQKVALYDKTQVGFCPSEEQCLVNPDAAAPCLSSGAYISNDLCLNGNWTTRTRAMAIAMLNLRENANYVLYCDSPEKSLVQGPIRHSPSTAEALGSNPACVMKTDTEILTGLTFDSAPSEEAMDILLKSANCESVQEDDGAFHPCEDDSIFYNKGINAFIAGTGSLGENPIGIGDIQEESLSPTILSRLKNALSSIASKWRDVFKTPSTRAYNGNADYNKINQTMAFNKLYMAKLGMDPNQRTVFGYYKEEPNLHQAVIHYSNFDNDICDLVQGYKVANAEIFKTAVGHGIGCVKEGKDYTLLMQAGRSNFANFDFDGDREMSKAWEDFTVKLRVS